MKNAPIPEALGLSVTLDVPLEDRMRVCLALLLPVLGTMWSLIIQLEIRTQLFRAVVCIFSARVTYTGQQRVLWFGFVFK